VACETQQPPNLNAPGGSILQFPTGGGSSTSASKRAPAKFNAAALAKAGRLLRTWDKTDGADARKKLRKAEKKMAKESKP
jgi:hypothetical protein